MQTVKPSAFTLSPARSAFTLIELLIVIAIIGVLSAIALVAGGKVLTGGKRTATQDMIRVLDTAVDAYISSKEGNPPPLVDVETMPGAAQSQMRVFPVADARDITSQSADPTNTNVNGNMINSLGLFMLQCESVPQTQGHLNGIPAKFIATRPIRGGANVRSVPTIVDAWGNAIRYVHPAFDGTLAGDTAVPGTGVALDDIELPDLKGGQQMGMTTQIRRTYKYLLSGAAKYGADGDGGTCVGNRPYFYSVGEDQKTGFEYQGAQTSGVAPSYNANSDNIYTTPPTLPAENL